MIDRGYSLIEVLAVVTLIVILAAVAVPLAHNTLDRSRTAGAASYVAAKEQAPGIAILAAERSRDSKR